MSDADNARDGAPNEDPKYLRRLIKNAGLRIARLAALDAPAVIILAQTETLVRRVERLCAAQNVVVATHRTWRAALYAEPVQPLSEAEAAEIERDEASHDKAEASAKAASGLSDAEWERLDSSYRFNLVMQHWKDVSDG